MGPRSADPPPPDAGPSGRRGSGGGGTVDAEELRALLLLEALECADPTGELVTLGERRRAAEQAATGSATEDDPLRALLGRGRTLLALASERELLGDAFGRGRRTTLAGLLVLVAFASGALLAGLGARRELNVLANALAGLLAWNVLALGALTALPRLVSGPGARSAERAGPLVRALLRWGSAVPRSAGRWLGERPRAWRLRATLAASWASAARDLLAARARLVLHLAALAFAAGAIASTYRSGLVVEYRASWESTFLGAETMAWVLRVVLAPGAALTGLSTPSAEELAAIRAPASGEAARWIHLWAASLAAWVGLPRTVLALASARRASRLARALPFELAQHPFLLRLSRATRGGGERVRILPYSLELDARRRESLLAFAADLHGARAHLELASPLAYGAEPDAAETAPDGEDEHERSFVLVFPAAQTPEAEVHGRFVAELAARLGARPAASARGTSRARLVALVDESGLRERLGEGEAARERLAERGRAWRAVLEEHGATVLVLDLAQPPAEELALRVAEAGGS